MSITNQDYCILTVGDINLRALRIFVDNDPTATFTTNVNVTNLDCSIVSCSVYADGRVNSYIQSDTNTYVGDITAINLYRTTYEQKVRYQTTDITVGPFVYASYGKCAFNIPIVIIAGDKKALYLPSSNDKNISDFTIQVPTTGVGGYVVANNSTVSFAVNISTNPGHWAYSTYINIRDITTDPYAGAGDSDTGGGSGSFDYTGDTIGLPSLPSIGAAATGFVNLFNPTSAQLKALSDYLWSPLFDLDTIKRLYADPMQQFIGLSLVPVSVPSSGAVSIKVGGIDTGVNLNAVSAANQFVEVNCGSITFNSSRLTASYLDYLPYTKTQLYLPYIGIVDVSTDDIMDKTMSIYYHVDILTGGCVAYVLVNGSVMYQYSGQCAINIPLTSQDWSNTISSALGLVSSAMHGLVAGASVPLTGALGVATAVEGVTNMGASAANAAINMKPTISKSGAIGGSAGMMAVQKPFLIVTCPNLAHAKNQDHYTGYPSFITKSVADCSGFCSFEEIYLNGIGLTDSEMDELHSIMQGGVYL